MGFLRPVVITTLCLSTLGGCKFFTTVVVPGVDNVSPNAIASIYVNGKHIIAAKEGAAPIDYVTDDGNSTFVMLAAAYDSGGAREVVMSAETRTHCVSGGFGSTAIATYPPLSKSQAGGIGDTVDNGVWTGEGVRFADIACRTGTLQSVTFQWAIEAEDMHGNTAVQGWNRITYRP